MQRSPSDDGGICCLVGESRISLGTSVDGPANELSFRTGSPAPFGRLRPLGIANAGEVP
jgi:hypothetical protein